MHALWECEAVKLVGGMDFGWVNRFEAAHGTFTELCDRIMTQPRFPEIFDNTAWFIWSYRSKTRLNESTQPLDRIPEAVHSFLSAFQRIKVLPRSTAPSRKKRRTAPTVGEFKKKFDGAMFDVNDNAGIGIIFQNSRGEVMVALSEKIPKPSSVEILEVLAVRRAVKFVQEIGLHDSLFEGDSLVGIKALQ